VPQPVWWLVGGSREWNRGGAARRVYFFWASRHVRTRDLFFGCAMKATGYRTRDAQSRPKVYTLSLLSKISVGNLIV
jgi:hypothetical protein